MAVTLHDICKATGLSSATVSRVLNNSPLVKDSTRERVREVMAELNYFPLTSARALAGKRTGSIGIVSPHVGSGFFADVLVGVDRVAAERGVHLMISFAHGIGDEQELVTRFISQRSVDAVILINLDLPTEFLTEIKNDRIPLVALDTPAVTRGIASVSIDNRCGARLMMTHLLEHGYRDIVILAGPENSYDSRERLEGCREALRTAGLRLLKKNILTGSFMMESGRKLTRRLLKSRRPLPDAIMALNDITAFGALAVLREAGLRVPQDIAVCGFDNCEAAPLVGLTTVAVPFEEMGSRAAEMALDILNGKLKEKHIIVAANLLVRESCGCGSCD